MQAPRKRAGRPAREPRPGERVPMSFRVTPELKARMDRISEESGRSVTQEVERLIEQALLVENMAGTKAWRIVFDVLKEIDNAAWLGEGLDDPANYLLAMSYSIVALAKHFPEQDPFNPSDYERDKWILSGIDDARQKIEKMLSGSEK